jgi:hypothetical protein
MASVSPIAMYGGTLFLEVTVPSWWPPQSDAVIFSGVLDTANIQISVTTAGKLLFRVNSECGSDEYLTPRLSLPNYACLKVAFAWGQGDGIGCAINGKCLSEQVSEPVVLDCKSHPPTGFRNHAVFQIPAGCETVEQSFLRFILDLQHRTAVSNRFDLLEASAILRRLLLDARPILHLVNRSYHERLRFPIAHRDPELLYDQAGQKPSFDHVFLSPTFADPSDIRHLKFDEFLSTPALHGHQGTYTVRDVIKVCANLKGGIHFDDPSTSVEQTLVELDKNYSPFFIDASLASLPDIAWATINGTRPLIEAILKRHGGG